MRTLKNQKKKKMQASIEIITVCDNKNCECTQCKLEHMDKKLDKILGLLE